MKFKNKSKSNKKHRFIVGGTSFYADETSSRKELEKIVDSMPLEDKLILAKKGIESIGKNPERYLKKNK